MSALYPELYPQIFACLDMVTAISTRFVCRAFAELPLPADPELKARNDALSCPVIRNKFSKLSEKNSNLSFLSFPKACCLMGYTELFWEAILSKQVAMPNNLDAIPLWEAEAIKPFSDYCTPVEQEMLFSECYNAAIVGGSEAIFSYLENTLKPTKECIYLCAKYQRREIAKRILKQAVPKDLALRSRTIAVPDADWLPNYYRDLQNGDENTLHYAIHEGNYALIPKLIKPNSVTWSHVLQARYMLHSSCENAQACYQILVKAATRKGYTCALQTVLALDDLELYKKESRSKTWKLEFIPQQAVIRKAYTILSHILGQPITNQTSLLEQLQLLKKHNYMIKDRSLVAHVVHEADMFALNFLKEELGPFLCRASNCIFPAVTKEFTPELLDFLHEHIPDVFNAHHGEEILKKNARVFLAWIKQLLDKKASICSGLQDCLDFEKSGACSLSCSFTHVIYRYDLVECLPYICINPYLIYDHNALRCLQYMLRVYPNINQDAFCESKQVHPRLKYELKKFKSDL